MNLFSRRASNKGLAKYSYHSARMLQSNARLGVDDFVAVDRSGCYVVETEPRFQISQYTCLLTMLLWQPHCTAERGISREERIARAIRSKRRVIKDIADLDAWSGKYRRYGYYSDRDKEKERQRLAERWVKLEKIIRGGD